MTDLAKSKPFVWGLFLVFSLLWLFALSMRTLVPTDEGRYAEMAREMVASGDWITTRLNGIKYFEKPPLQTWMSALAFEAFGLGAWQARLWTGVSGLFGIVLVGLAGRSVFGPRVGLYAALVLASCLWWSVLGHVNTLDMGLSGMMTLSLCALLIAQRDDAKVRERRNWMLACWAGMALAVLSKGLIGLVLPGAVLVLYTLFCRDWAIWRRLHLAQGLLVFFALTVPWFLLVSLKNPEFPHFFFIHEHFERFLTKTHHREGPWYYFVPLLLIGVLPWLGILPQSIANAFGRGSEEATQFKPKSLLLIWAGFIFFFFSYSGSKLPSYILPIFPALALLIALYLERATARQQGFAAGLIAVLAALGLLFVPRIAQMSTHPIETPMFEAVQPWLTGVCLLLVFGASLSVFFAYRLKRDLAVLTLAAATFCAIQILSLASEPFGAYRAGLALVPAINAELTPQTPIYALGLYEQSLPFYLRRTLILVEHMDELEFGLKQEPDLWIPTRAAFLEKWSQGPKAIAITNPQIFAALQKKGVAMRVLARDTRRVVITNQ